MRQIWQKLRQIFQGMLFKVVVALLSVITVVAVLGYTVEHSANPLQFRSFGDSMWWTIVTMATVGYGDKVPITPAGRLVGVFAMFSGVVLISLLTATVSSILVTRIIKENRGLKQVRFKNHTIICGWNYNTEDILRTFNHHVAEAMDIVLVNELSPERAESLLHQFTNLRVQYVHGDFTKENPLHLANIKLARSVIILPDISTGISQQTDDRTLLATLTAKSQNPKVKVYAHIVNRSNFTHLKRARADEVIVSNEYIGFFLANMILHPGAPQVVHELLDEQYGQYIRRVPVPREFVGKPYGDLFNYFKREKNWTLIGLTADVEGVQIKDVLSHDYSALDAFIERKFREAGINVEDRRDVRTFVNPPLDHQITPKDFAVVIGPLQVEAS